MDYTCPHCNGGWTIGENYYRGGSVFSCGSCNKLSVINLYCPNCYPISVARKTWLDTPQGNLGGRLFRCDRGHSFRVPVTAELAHSKLRGWGAEVGQYHQSKRIETLRDVGTKNAVSGGYCSGACYDWIRRVLVSSTAKVTYLNLEDSVPKTGPLTGAMAKQHRQDQRAALMQRQEINPLLRTKSQQLVDKLNTDLDLAYQNYSREHDRINAMPGTRAVKDPLWAQNERNLQESQASLQRAYDQKIATAPVELVWAEFRKKMDQAIAQQRRQLGKTGMSARPFENLDVAAAQGSKEYTGEGLRALVTEVLNNPEFKPDRAAHVGVNPPQGGTGHAIAIHRQNTGGKYHFFDPNFGVYEFTKANLIEAFVFIFGTAYPHWAGGGTSDDHPYEVNGRTKGSWTVFKGNRVAPPEVVETPRPVQVIVEPPVTLQVVRTPQNIAVTTQTGPVVTGSRPGGTRTPTPQPNPNPNPQTIPQTPTQTPPRVGGRAKVLDRWKHGS
jgi:hypothetical protein